jgi:hypothetical protein
MGYLLTLAVGLLGFCTGVGLPGSTPAIVVGAGLSGIVGVSPASQFLTSVQAGFGGLFVAGLFVAGAFMGLKAREAYEGRS